MTKYELIYLDADDTIFDYQKCEKKSLKKSLEHYKIECNNEIVGKYAKINSKLWSRYENREITQDFLRTERFRLLFNELEIDVNEFDFSDIYLENLGNSSYLIEDADQVLNYLSSRYSLAIITNGIAEVQKSRIAKSTIKKFIRNLIISEEARSNKPNIEIFLYAEKITTYKNKEKTLIIGDSLHSDIQGGLNYGIDTCWFNPKRITNTTNIVPNYVINRLNDLYSFL